MVNFGALFLENARNTHWVGVCVGPRGGLDAVEKRKIFFAPARDEALAICSYSIAV
jgi:hypothetical protein